jgi:hypothetical protein
MMSNVICINYHNHMENWHVQSYEMLLDIQKLDTRATGGLSGLSKVYNHCAELLSSYF